MSLATQRILIDTGPLVALLNRNDQYHEVCTEQARHLPERVFTCWPVLTEACYLLRSRPDLVGRLLEACSEGVYEILAIDVAEITEIGGVLQKYRDQDIDLADATLVHLANRESINFVMTVDHRHFSIFRTNSGAKFELIPATL